MARNNNSPTKSSRRKAIFNLLKPYAPPPTAWDKIYDWLVGRARLVMIIAEIVVAISFVTKVVVDVQAKNLDEQIEAANLELGAFAATIEPRLRQLQQKAKTYQTVWEESASYAEVIAEILDGIPNLSAEVDIRINENKLSIRGDDTINTLSQIEANIKGSPTFSAVSISTLTSEGGEVTSDEGRLVLNAIVNVKGRGAISEDTSATDLLQEILVP